MTVEANAATAIRWKDSLRIGSGKAPDSHRNHGRRASAGLRASSALSSEKAPLPPSIRVAPIAELQAAIVHSSMQVAPCHPNVSISITERPIETKAAARVNKPVIRSNPVISSAALNRISEVYRR